MKRVGSQLVAAALVLVLVACSEAPLGPLSVTELATPAGEFSGPSHLAMAPDGSVILNWLESTTGEGMALKYTVLAPASEAWTQPRTLAESESWFINWADFPSIVPMSETLWAAHWLAYREDYSGYDIQVAISHDGGVTWDDPFLLNTDGTVAEHGFVTLFPLDGDIAAVWLDGRNMIVDGEYAYESSTGEMLGTSLRYAQFDANGERLTDVSLDDLVCDCCQPDIAHTPNGPILIYRDRTTEEVRDIVVRRMIDGEWQAVQALPADNWAIEACPINGPAISAKDDVVAAAWFSAANDAPFVRYARSTDGGASFGDSIEIDASGSYGYVDVELLDNGDAVVSWLRSSGEDLGLVTRRVTPAGDLMPVEPVVDIDIGRPLDFPQMVTAGERLVFVWTDYTSGSNVKTGVGRYGP